MSDQEVMRGGEDGAPPEGPEPYDDTGMGDVLTPEEYDRLPGWKKGRIAQLSEKRRLAETELAEERGQRKQLEARLASIEQRVLSQSNGADKEPEPQGWARFETDKLDNYLVEYRQAQRKFAMNPEDEAARAAFLEYDPRHIQAVEDEKSRRIAGELVSGVEKKRGDERATEQAFAAFQRGLADEYGPDIARPTSELMRTAAAEMEALASARGLPLKQMQSDPGYIEMAVDRAHRKLHGDRGGRGADEARRHLAVEAGVRREAAPTNAIAALRSKGDWKSVDRAQDIEINEFLKANFGF